MKKSKGVYVTKRDIKENQLQTFYQLYTSRVTNKDIANRYNETHDVACQFDSKRGNIFYNCKNVIRRPEDFRYFSGYPKQVYTYHKSRSFTEIRVGNVKTLQKKKVKKIYLPETDDRGVGSSDLSTFINRRTRYYKENSYYNNKKTSSKCVGGIKECGIGYVLNKKVSSVLQIKSGATSSKLKIEENKNNTEIGSNTIVKHMVTTTTQVEEYTQDCVKQFSKEIPKELTKDKIYKAIGTTPTIHKSKLSIKKRINKLPENTFSSDSSVQQVHDLENPSEDKQSRLFLAESVDPMENKLEKEYRKMFVTKMKQQNSSIEKPIGSIKSGILDFKSASLLRRRFEALRREIARKDVSKRNAVIINKELSNNSTQSHKDVSITSDPPSLEARSYSNTKIYSPFSLSFNEVEILTPETTYKKSFISKREELYIKENSIKQGVKGMFKLWGKKFNLEEKSDRKISSLKASYYKKEHNDSVPKKGEKVELNKKKEGRKFVFFKKKSKDKTKKPYKSKKEVTAGRCEVGDGFMIKIGAAINTFASREMEGNKVSEKISKEDYEETLRETWIKNFLSESIEPRNSVQIRWNNKMYATSSSTVFELMENVYKQTGVVLKSRSEITTGDSSCKSFSKAHVNFVQNIEAWMIPEKPIKIVSKTENDNKSNMKANISNRKWFIDKSKTFGHKVEVVLHSKNFVLYNKNPSTEYLRINIPKGFFPDSTSDSDEHIQTSNEEVYKIVEYDTNTDAGFKFQENLETGDSKISTNNVKLTIRAKDSKDFKSRALKTVIKRSPIHRDVVIQCSNVAVPKRCDVIGIGIIIQRDISEIRNPILKKADFFDDESIYSICIHGTKCEFAGSYLQDYYRYWMPLGIDLFPCVSDSQLQCCSDDSNASINNQGNSSKSCPNIYEDYHASAILSSCANSSCSRCQSFDDLPKVDGKFTTKLFSKFKQKSKEPSENSAKRVLPKDSFEVFKKRKLYAASNKSKWFISANDKPYSVPSKDDKEAQDTLIEGTKLNKTCCKPAESNPAKKSSQKHVSLPDFDVLKDSQLSKLRIFQNVKDSQLLKISNKLLEGILTFKGLKCEACKKKGSNCPKHATVNPKSCEIPQPLCKESCEKDKNPACSKPNMPPCNVSSPRFLSPLHPNAPSPPTQKRFTPRLLPRLQSSRPPCERSSPHSFSPLQKPFQCPLRPRSPPAAPCPISPQLSANQSAICIKPSPPHQTESPLRHKTFSRRNSPPCNSRTIPIKTSSSPHSSSCQQSSPLRTSPLPLCHIKQHKKIKSPQKHNTSPPPSKNPIYPCDECMKASCQDFPWPMKNHFSNQPSLESCVSSKRSPATKECDPTTKAPPKKKYKPCPSPPKAGSKPKISGIFLKKEPSNKNSNSNEYVSLSQECPRMNSEDKILIRIKKVTPSTEEIREGLNIKVQDADGKTLYERRDYSNQQYSKHKPSILRDMYKDSCVNRFETPNATNVQMEENSNQEIIEKNNVDLGQRKTEASIANLIEIHFKLKVTQGDKTTEINIGNDEENDSSQPDNKPEIKNQIGQTSQDVFILKDDQLASTEDPNAKNDINIQIIIKNYKQKSSKKSTERYNLNEDYCKKISKQFHTVSTGYSDVLNEHENVFSVHRTTVDLSPSTDKSKIQIKSSEEVMNQVLTGNSAIQITMADQENLSIDHPHSEKIIKSETDEVQIITSIKESKVIDKKEDEETLEEKSETRTSVTDSDEHNLDMTNTSDELNIENSIEHEYESKPVTREVKKELLKKLFEKTSFKKGKNKNRMKQLRNMLKVILTSDSSDHEEIAVTSNELVKDLTYASLKPNYFKDMDSMNNYYKIDSKGIMSVKESIGKPVYPTEEHSEVGSGGDSSDNDSNEAKGCLCSTVASRLKMCKRVNIGSGCCCRDTIKIDEENSFDLETDIDLFSLNYKTKYIDMETQNSKLSNTVDSIQIVVQKIKSKNINNELIYKKASSKATTKRTLSPQTSCEEESRRSKLNSNRIGVSDETIVIVKNPHVCVQTNIIGDFKKKYGKLKRANLSVPADILQSYEAKKAVLEIYAEETNTRKGERVVANLPKFVDKESGIKRNNNKCVSTLNSVYNKNHIMTSVKR